MRTRFAPFALVALPFTALLLLVAAPARACGPELPYAVFGHELHPDRPYEAYAAGRLGLLRPGFARSFLCVAYRSMQRGSLAAPWQGVALATWDARDETRGWDATSDEIARWKGAITAWLAARGAVPGVQAATSLESYGDAIGRSAPFGSYYQLRPVPAEAFEQAARTLDEKRHAGAPPAALRAWVTAQDSVFSARGGHVPQLPDAATGETSDRAYQAAAAAFHAGAYAEAERAFTAIAADPSSRWRVLAPYLAARSVALGAQRSLGAPDWGMAIDLAEMRRAEAMLAAVLADGTRRDVHPAARRLLGYVRFRAHPAERLGELAASLMAERPGPDAAQDFEDLLRMLDRIVTLDSLGGAREAVQATGRATDLVDWVLTFQQLGDGPAPGHPGEDDEREIVWSKDPYAHALARWRATHSDAWLVCALAGAGPRSAGVEELLAASAALPQDAPARVTATFHRARVLAQRGEAAAARTACERELSAPGVPLSADNALRAVRAAAASGLEDFLAWAVRAPAEIVMGQDLGQVDSLSLAPRMSDVASDEGSLPDLYRRPFLLRHRPECFDADAAACFDRRLPLETWVRAAGRATLPVRLRRELALAGWTRAVLLGREPEARAFAAVLDSLAPDCRADLASWRAARGADARAFAAAFLMARRPGAQPFVRAGLGRLEVLERLDDYRDNWWCGRGSERDYFAAPQLAVVPEGEGAIAGTACGGFLSAAGRSAADREWSELATVAGAPKWIGTRILAFARAHPKDPRVPEALHRVVRAVRLGCGEANDQALAREAFRLLHSRYPADPWTKRTRSWG